MVFFPYLNMLTAVFSYWIFLLSKRGVNQIEFTFITHFFLWGSVHISFEVFSTLLIDFLAHFCMTMELTGY